MVRPALTLRHQTYRVGVALALQGEDRWPGRGLYGEPHGDRPAVRSEQPRSHPFPPRSAPEALSSIAALAGVQHCRGRPSTPCPKRARGCL
jgi:hypothetical protein